MLGYQDWINDDLFTVILLHYSWRIKNKNNQGRHLFQKKNDMYKITYHSFMLQNLIYHDYRTITGFDSCVLTNKKKALTGSQTGSQPEIQILTSGHRFIFARNLFFFVKTQRYVLCLFALTNFWKGRAKRLPVIVPFPRENFFVKPQSQRTLLLCFDEFL